MDHLANPEMEDVRVACVCLLRHASEVYAREINSSCILGNRAFWKVELTCRAHGHALYKSNRVTRVFM